MNSLKLLDLKFPASLCFRRSRFFLQSTLGTGIWYIFLKEVQESGKVVFKEFGLMKQRSVKKWEEFYLEWKVWISGFRLFEFVSSERQQLNREALAYFTQS